MKRLAALALFFCLFVTAAPRTALSSDDLDEPSSYPASFRIQHRVTLTVAGRQVGFTGYLLVQQSTWRAMAFGEFGVSLFDITASPEKGRRVIQTNGIPASYLTRQAADIIEILFLPRKEKGEGLAERRKSVAERRVERNFSVRHSDIFAFEAKFQSQGGSHRVMNGIHEVSRLRKILFL